MTETEAQELLKTLDDRKVELEAESQEQMLRLPSILDGSDSYEGMTGAEGANALQQKGVAPLFAEMNEISQRIVTATMTANQSKIQDIHKDLMDSISTYVESITEDYADLGPKPITQLIWTLTQEVDEDGNLLGDPKAQIQVNPTTTRRKSSGGRSGTRSSAQVSRTKSDGSVETMSVKEVVETYATDELRNRIPSSFEKANWAYIYDKLNTDLSPSFTEVSKAS